MGQKKGDSATPVNLSKRPAAYSARALKVSQACTLPVFRPV